MKFNIHVYHHYENDLLNLKLDTIMARLQELIEKVDQLQSALDVEQEQIQNAISELQETVQRLEALVADGGTEEERQALSDKLDAVITDLQSTIPDSTTTTSTTTEAPPQE